MKLIWWNWFDDIYLMKFIWNNWSDSTDLIKLLSIMERNPFFRSCSICGRNCIWIMHCSLGEEEIHSNTAMLIHWRLIQGWRAEGSFSTLLHGLAEWLTLSQPGVRGADYVHHSLQAPTLPPDFQTLRRPWHALWFAQLW